MICIVNIICAVICGIIANAKGRNVLGWSFLGLLGLIPIIIVACLPNLSEQAAKDAYVAEENRRLREQLRQERIKSESFRQHATARLDAHDQHLGLDTRTLGPALGAGGAGDPVAGQLGVGFGAATPTGGGDLARWYYGREGKTVGPKKDSEMEELIRVQFVTRQTVVWCENMADWRPAGEVPEFAGQFD